MKKVLIVRHETSILEIFSCGGHQGHSVNFIYFFYPEQLEATLTHYVRVSSVCSHEAATLGMRQNGAVSVWSEATLLFVLLAGKQRRAH